MLKEWCGCMFYPTSKGLSWVLNQCNGFLGDAHYALARRRIISLSTIDVFATVNEWQQQQVLHGIAWPWSYLCQKIAETLRTPIPQDNINPVFAARRLLAWPGYSPVSVVCKVFSIFDTFCIVRCRREISQLICQVTTICESIWLQGASWTQSSTPRRQSCGSSRTKILTSLMCCYQSLWPL